MKQVVCLSTSPWYPFPTRKQQVMSRLPDSEILFFDPAVTYLAPLVDRKNRKQLRAFKQPPVKPQPNVTVYATPPLLPFFNRFRFINRINQKRLARFVEKKMAEHGFTSPLLWTYSPTACDAVDRIPHTGLVYDCVDRHSAYGGQMNPAVVDQMEKELAEKSQMVFATAKPLAERLQAFNAKAVFIPNGANYALFSKANEPQPVPEALKDLEGPVFAFVGVLQACIDYDYVSVAAKAHPEWNFVFMGRENPGVDLLDLKRLPNVRFLGLVPHEQLPAYLARCQVCLNLFDGGALSKDVSPLKFYEYLATGKPIVSTPQPDQVLQYRDLIHIAQSPDAFCRCCQEALGDTADQDTEKRMAAGKDSAWDARVAQMCEILKKEQLF